MQTLTAALIVAFLAGAHAAQIHRTDSDPIDSVHPGFPGPRLPYPSAPSCYGMFSRVDQVTSQLLVMVNWPTSLMPRRKKSLHPVRYFM